MLIILKVLQILIVINQQTVLKLMGSLIICLVLKTSLKVDYLLKELNKKIQNILVIFIWNIVIIIIQ